MLGCSSDIFEIIVAIWRLDELPRKEQREMLEYLEHELLSWCPLIAGELNSRATIDIAIAYQQAALLLLYARESVIIPDPQRDEARRQKIQDIAHELLQLMLSSEPSPFTTTALWPLMILSCFVKSPTEQSYIRNTILTSEYDLTMLDNVMEILEDLWKSNRTESDCFNNLDVLIETRGLCMS